MANIELEDKPKLKRGRPKKNSNLIENVNKSSNIYQVGQIIRKSCNFVKQYIVSLNINSNDLLTSSLLTNVPIMTSNNIIPTYDNISTYENITTYENISNDSLLDNLNYYNNNIPTEKLNIPNFYPIKVINIIPDNIPFNFNSNEFVNSNKLANSNKFANSNKLTNSNEHVNSNELSNENENENLLLCSLLKNKYGNDWPEKSSYLCWNCDMSFNSCPVGIPDKEYMGKYYCYGNFCSFSCTARYIYEKESNTDYIKKYSMLCTLYQYVNNLTPDTKIILAPARELREKYGGTLSDEKYKEIINSTNNEIKYEIYKLPLVPTYLHISQIYNTISNSNINYIKTQNKDVIKVKKFIPLDKDDLKKSQENVKKLLIGTPIN
jgi:hypothetical protein